MEAALEENSILQLTLNVICGKFMCINQDYLSFKMLPDSFENLIMRLFSRLLSYYSSPGEDIIFRK